MIGLAPSGRGCPRQFTAALPAMQRALPAGEVRSDWPGRRLVKVA
jgi:hypothetical protein